MTARIAWMFALARGGSGAASVLPIVAFGIVTALLLIVAGGTVVFWSWTDSTFGAYRALSAIALALLAVPLVSLGGSAARLSARRRDDRLSTLRLLGATPGMVARLTVLESTSLAAIGCLAGVAGYLALTPLVGLIPFRGEMLGAAALLLPWWGILSIVAGVIALSAISAVAGLRLVVLSPLGVRTRQNAPRLRWLRILIGAVVVALGFGLTRLLGVATDITFLAIMLGLAFAITMGVVNLAGPFVIWMLAKLWLRRAKTAPRLLAARAILDSPQAAWRQVSGVAMTSFMAVAAGSGIALLANLSPDEMTGELRRRFKLCRY